MAIYRQKCIYDIEAEQFVPPLKIPKGVMNVYEMNPGSGYFAGEVWTIQGEKVRVHPGEWIVQERGNPERYYPIADVVFKEKYELIS
jgi:hypothetical protein